MKTLEALVGIVVLGGGGLFLGFSVLVNFRNARRRFHPSKNWETFQKDVPLAKFYMPVLGLIFFAISIVVVVGGITSLLS